MKPMLDNAKFTARSVNNIIKDTNWDLVPYTQGEQSANMFVIGYQQPSSANWSYWVGISNRDGKTYMLVKRFGGVVGVLELYTGSDQDERAKAEA